MKILSNTSNDSLSNQLFNQFGHFQSTFYVISDNLEEIVKELKKKHLKNSLSCNTSEYLEEDYNKIFVLFEKNFMKLSNKEVLKCISSLLSCIRKYNKTNIK